MIVFVAVAVIANVIVAALGNGNANVGVTDAVDDKSVVAAVADAVLAGASEVAEVQHGYTRRIASARFTASSIAGAPSSLWM